MLISIYLFNIYKIFCKWTISRNRINFAHIKSKHNDKILLTKKTFLKKRSISIELKLLASLMIYYHAFQSADFDKPKNLSIFSTKNAFLKDQFLFWVFWINNNSKLHQGPLVIMLKPPLKEIQRSRWWRSMINVRGAGDILFPCSKSSQSYFKRNVVIKNVLRPNDFTFEIWDFVTSMCDISQEPHSKNQVLNGWL